MAKDVNRTRIVAPAAGILAATTALPPELAAAQQPTPASQRVNETTRLQPSANSSGRPKGQEDRARVPEDSGDVRALDSITTLKWNWGRKHGEWYLWLDWDVVRASSRVLVSATEGVVGSARFQVQNVNPYSNGVVIRVNIDWGSDLPLFVSYLVLN